jgi:hypothetical protein
LIRLKEAIMAMSIHPSESIYRGVSLRNDSHTRMIRTHLLPKEKVHGEVLHAKVVLHLAIHQLSSLCGVGKTAHLTEHVEA